MKKTLLKLLISSLVACSLFTACNNAANGIEDPVNQNPVEDFGSVSAKVFIPDYYATALAAQEAKSSRLVYPNTAKINFYTPSSGSWKLHSSVDFATAEREYLEDDVHNFVGYVYKVEFSLVPSAIYPANTMKVELVDAGGKVLSSAVNEEQYTVSLLEKTTATFYTKPVEANKAGGTLEVGEMGVAAQTIPANKYAALHITAESSEGNPLYPDLVFFDENGCMVKYEALDAEEGDSVSTVYRFEPEDADRELYVGFYNDEDEVIEYKSLLTVSNDPVTQCTDKSALSDYINNNLYTSSAFITKTQLDDEDVVKFDYSYWNFYIGTTDTGTSPYTYSCEVNSSTPTLIEYSVKTDIYEQYDGYLAFVIDGEIAKAGKYTGTEGHWKPYGYVIPAGVHTIAWMAVDINENKTTGYTNTVYLKDIEIKEVLPANEMLLNFNNSGYFDTQWTIITDNSSSKVKPELFKASDIADLYYCLPSSEYVVCFDCFASYGDSGMAATFTLQEAKKLTFLMYGDFEKFADPYAAYNGTFKFILDGNELEEGPEKLESIDPWIKGGFDIPAGEHTIEIVHSDPSESYAMLATFYTYFADFKFE